MSKPADRSESSTQDLESELLHVTLELLAFGETKLRELDKLTESERDSVLRQQAEYHEKIDRLCDLLEERMVDCAGQGDKEE